MATQEILKMAQIMFYFGSILLAILAFYNVRTQLIQSKKTARVKFLFDLQKNWLTNHTGLAREFIGNGLFAALELEKEEDRASKHFEVRDYLHFFELVAIAIRNKSVDIDQVDDLFGHRFCRLYKNKWVQEKIVNYHEYADGYKMLREFGDKWIEHRKKKDRIVDYNSTSMPYVKSNDSQAA